MVYATYSEGFRPGGINRNGSVPPYKPDYLYNYEVGWKTSWADNRVRFNGATFIEKWNGMQFSTLPPGGAGLTVIQNAGESRIIGIESDLAWVPVDRLTLSGGFMLVDAQTTTDFLASGGEIVPKDTRLPVTPKFKGTVTGRYEFPAGSYDAHVQGSLIYSGSSWSDLLLSDRAFITENAAYFIADFSAGVKKDSYSVEMYLNNALDTRAEQFKFTECDTAVCGAQPYTATNRPRTIGLRFGRKF
jgi:outer membrane receptor protein involved in Fe transport